MTTTEEKDPRDILADWYEANPEKYEPMSYGDHTIGKDMLNSGLDAHLRTGICPAGGLCASGLRNVGLRINGEAWGPIWYASVLAREISDWVLCIDTDWRTREEVIDALRVRTYPFDNETLGIEG